MNTRTFVWIVGDTDARKYRIVEDHGTALVLMPLQEGQRDERLTIYQQDGQWKIPEFETFNLKIFIEHFNTQKVNADQPPPIDAILVGSYHDGRSRYLTFWKVISTTKAGNCRLSRLQTKTYLYYADPGNRASIICPLNEIADELATTTKIKSGQLKVKKDYYLEYFDPVKAYVIEWLSD